MMLYMMMMIGVSDVSKGSYGTLAGLFGRMVCDKEIDAVSPHHYNEQRQVFESSCWDQLIAALREKLLHGDNDDDKDSDVVLNVSK